MREKFFQWKLRRIQKKGERYKREKELRDKYEPYVPERKKRRVSNIILVIIVIAILVYTAASFWIQYQTGMPVDPTLTTCFYTFWGSELALLAGIKASKIFKGHETDSPISDDVEALG